MSEPLQLLIVDDEETIRHTLVEFAQLCGYHPLEAANGEQALEVLRSSSVDILIADLVMPGIDGFALMQYVKECHPQMPVIVITAYGSLETAIRAIRLGAYDYLLKPFDMTLVDSALRRAEAAVMRRKAEEEMQQRSRELTALHRATNAITASLDPTEVLTSILVETQQVLRVDGASVLLIDPETGELVFRATSNVLQKLIGLRLPPNKGVANWSVQQNQPVLINDVSQDPRFYSGIDQATNYATRNLLAVPLRIQSKVIGVLEAVNKLEGPFSEHDLSLLESLALPAAAAIQNALLYQEQLENRDLLRAVLNSAGDGIAVIDKKGRVLLHNPAADAIFGVSSGTAIGQNITDLVGARSDQISVISPKGATLQQYLEAVLSASESEHFVLEVTSPERHVLDTLMTTVRYPSGERRACLLTWRDITREKEMARWREDLSHIIVHDLRNPLSLVRVGVEAAQMLLPAGVAADALQGLSLALQGIAQLERKTEVLLAVNQMETGEQLVNPVPVSLKEIVAAAQSFHSFDTQERGLTLAIDIPADMPPIQGDRDLLEWTIGNLIDNAIRHSPSAGVVSIWARAEAGGVAIRVKDMGACIPPEHSEHIFTKFHQVQTPEGRRSSGLGLYFCKLAVQAHGGSISVESESDEGCTFKVWLPLSPKQ